jgi:hypothetical protein
MTEAALCKPLVLEGMLLPLTAQLCHIKDQRNVPAGICSQRPKAIHANATVVPYDHKYSRLLSFQQLFYVTRILYGTIRDLFI